MNNSVHLLRGATVALSMMGAIMVGATGPARAADAGNSDANVKVVQDFIDSWKDADKSATYLAPDAAVRLEEDKPPVIGPGPYLAAVKSFTADGTTFSAKILSTFARGPVVVDSRIDTVKTPGKPDQALKVAGVFIVKDGKIKEWTDYVYK